MTRLRFTFAVNPAMAAGLADHAWTLADTVGLSKAAERKAIESGVMKRGEYQPRQTATPDKL